MNTSYPRIDGQVALVTGAAGDLGSAIALGLLAAGARVALLDSEGPALVDRHGAAAKKAVGRLLLLPGCDIADEMQVARAVDETVRVLGGLRMLVNNAALLTAKSPIGDMSIEQWRRTIDVNLTGSWLMARAAIVHMKAGGGGVVLNVASQLGQVAARDNGVYGLTKAGLIAMSRAIAVDHAADGIRGLSLSPGAIMTSRLTRRYGSEAAVNEALGKYYLAGEVGAVDEVAEAALFLLNGGRFLNGSDLLIDGGYTAV